MSLMMALKRMFRSSSRLSDIERTVLETVRAALDPSLVDLWDRQIQAINKIQRLPKGVEVDFYRMKDGRPHRDPAYAFPNKTLELEIAKVTIQAPNVRPLIARVWAVRGYVFSIEYAGVVAYFEEVMGVELALPLQLRCELQSDLAVVIDSDDPEDSAQRR